ncbi:cobyrinate a,c-diamide synthase [Nitrospirota bacterium]
MSLVIAGTQSGCGKSTVALGIMTALRARGLSVQPFKAGPDFIDPGLHTLVTGRVSRNLDLWMCGEEHVRRTMAAHADADAFVIEGVMGYYDGGERSTAALAKAINANVLLVINAYGMAESVAAIVEGFKNHGGPVDAILFNNVGSERHFERLRDAVKDVEVIGYLPRDLAFEIPERHLGLMVAEEGALSTEGQAALAKAISMHLDLDKVAELARPDMAKEALPDHPGPVVTIAVARDRAFCFYYEDNLDMLRNAGASIVFFSPMEDETLPEGIDAVYLGGGYPEMRARELSANASMRESIKTWVHEGRPLYAECGGLMYLGRGIHKADEYFLMAGALPIETALRLKRSSLGYREVNPPEDSILGGGPLRGHEFHYSEVVTNDEGPRYNVMNEDASNVSSVLYKNTLASYVHVHFGSRVEVAHDIVEFIEKAKSRQGEQRNG